MTDREAAGQFEQLVLLGVLHMDDNAYGMTVRREIEERTGRSVSLGALYATLDRMERKGFVRSGLAPGGSERNRRAKRFYRVEPAGLRALRRALMETDRMRVGVPAVSGRSS